jgi:hypothetical protein
MITQYFPTIHAVCIGPVMSKVIQKAMESKLVIILDADALYMLSLDEACQGCRHFFRQN